MRTLFYGLVMFGLGISNCVKAETFFEGFLSGVCLALGAMFIVFGMDRMSQR